MENETQDSSSSILIIVLVGIVVLVVVIGIFWWLSKEENVTKRTTGPQGPQGPPGPSGPPGNSNFNSQTFLYEITTPSSMPGTVDVDVDIPTNFTFSVSLTAAAGVLGDNRYTFLPNSPDSANIVKYDVYENGGIVTLNFYSDTPTSTNLLLTIITFEPNLEKMELQPVNNQNEIRYYNQRRINYQAQMNQNRINNSRTTRLPVRRRMRR